MIITNYSNKLSYNLPNKNYSEKTCQINSFKSSGPENNYAQNIANINFASQNIKKKQANEKRLSELEKELSPIKTTYDYLNVLDNVYNSTTLNGAPFWRKESDFARHEHIPAKYIGLLPYCGDNDVSWEINSYLGGRIKYKKSKSLDIGKYIPTHDSIKNVVRALDFSLNQLDDEFGKYQGLVFRKGYMAEHSGQYVSSSTNPGIAANFNGYNDKSDYSIIETKNGHKIYEFQKLMDNDFETREREVLLPRKSEYELVPPEDYDDKLRKAVYVFAFELSIASKSQNAITEKPLSYEDAIKKIKVYREVKAKKNRS